MTIDNCKRTHELKQVIKKKALDSYLPLRSWRSRSPNTNSTVEVTSVFLKSCFDSFTFREKNSDSDSESDVNNEIMLSQFFKKKMTFFRGKLPDKPAFFPLHRSPPDSIGFIE